MCVWLVKFAHATLYIMSVSFMSSILFVLAIAIQFVHAFYARLMVMFWRSS